MKFNKESFGLMQQRNKVKGPILIPFTIVLVCAVGALFLLAYSYESDVRQRDLSSTLKSVEHLFNLQIENDAARLHAALCPISRDSDIVTAFLEGNRDELLAKTEPLFERLRDQHRVTHFYILDTDRKVRLRVHQPDIRGDIVERATTLQAQRSGSETHGIELGPLGTLTLRAVKPWRRDGRLIGYLELGEEISHVGEEIHHALGVDLIVAVHRRFLEPVPVKDPVNTSEKPELVIFSSTLDEVPPGVDALLRGSENERAVKETQHRGQSLYTVMLPLSDAAGREIGNIIVVRDVTSLQAGFRKSLVFAAVLSLLSGALVFGLFYVILDRVERDYRRQHEIETQFARLSTEHQRIVQIEKLSEVGRTISEIAHQINNPLVGVVNMAQLAEREADDPVRVRELLADIRQAGADSHAFLQRMLAFTKVSRFEHKPTEMTNLIEQTIALFQQSLKQHPTIHTEFPLSPLVLDVDPILVRHALFNLLSNAAQFNPPGDRITVRLIQKTGPDTRPGWSLEISDQGPGLSKEVQEKLFMPFFTTQPSGTGLGLAVVQHVAMLHDGRATGENRVGGGAIFALWLPQRPTTQDIQA